MRKTRNLLSGDTLVLDVPDAADLPGSTAISVLLIDGVELELTSGTAADLEFYLSLSGTTLTSETTLRSGTVLRHGRYGGDPAQGVGFSATVGDHEIYGFTVPTMDVETLTGHLAQVSLEAAPEGPVVRAARATAVPWSPYRTHTVAQAVHVGDERGYLLDVRRTRNDRQPAGTDGIGVRGGRLSRSSVQERHAYAVLEALDFVSYGVPGGADDLDRVATSMSQVRTELG